MSQYLLLTECCGSGITEDQRCELCGEHAQPVALEKEVLA